MYIFYNATISNFYFTLDQFLTHCAKQNPWKMSYLATMKTSLPNVLKDVQVTSPEDARARVKNIKTVRG
jgi:hypothetical protein